MVRASTQHPSAQGCCCHGTVFCGWQYDKQRLPIQLLSSSSAPLSLSLSLSFPSIHSSSTRTASRASFAYRRLHLIFLSSPCLPRCRPTKWLWLKTHPSSSHLLSRDFSSTVSHALTPSTTDLSLSHSNSLSRPPALHCWPTLASSASQLPGNCLVISHVSTLRRRLRRA
jgi:hypothetical protein